MRTSRFNKTDLLENHTKNKFILLKNIPNTKKNLRRRPHYRITVCNIREQKSFQIISSLEQNWLHANMSDKNQMILVSYQYAQPSSFSQTEVYDRDQQYTPGPCVVLLKYQKKQEHNRMFYVK